jgi:hypothetical protein
MIVITKGGRIGVSVLYVNYSQIVEEFSFCVGNSREFFVFTLF